MVAYSPQYTVSIKRPRACSLFSRFLSCLLVASYWVVEVKGTPSASSAERPLITQAASENENTFSKEESETAGVGTYGHTTFLPRGGEVCIGAV